MFHFWIKGCSGVGLGVGVVEIAGPERDHVPLEQHHTYLGSTRLAGGSPNGAAGARLSGC